MNKEMMIKGLMVFTMLGAMMTVPSAAMAQGTGETILSRDAIWYFNDKGIDLGTAWRDPAYNDAMWRRGRAPLGFGDDFSETDPTLPLATSVDYGAADNKHMTTYFRTTADVKGLDGVKDLEVFIHVDDGAVVYVNGVEAFRKGIPEGPMGFSTSGKFKPKEETFKVPASILREGRNTFAVEVHQDGPDSSDLWFEMGIRNPDAKAANAPAVKAKDSGTAPKGVSKVTVSFTGDTTSTKGFTWYTPLELTRSDLQVVEAMDSTASFVNAMKFQGLNHPSTNSPKELVHKAEATGLKADTSYRYRVGDSSTDTWSISGTFRTAPKQGAFSFTDVADTQAKSEDETILSAKTMAKALATVPTAGFMVHNGDLVDTGMNESQWDSFLGKGMETLMNTTIAPTSGNHEEDKGAFIDHFNIRAAQGSPTDSGAYYSFDYSNAHVIVVNNNEDSKEYEDFTPAQMEWIKADVGSARAKGADWVVMVCHKGPYTTSNHATDNDIMGPNGVRTKVAPLLSELGVDLVLQGHDHIYARTKPIHNGRAVPAPKEYADFNGIKVEYTLKPQGTVYVIPGTAGAKVYYRNRKIDPGYYSLFQVADENHAAPYGPDPSDPSRPVRGQVQHFMGFHVEGKRLTGIAYEIDKSRNNGEPFIIDAFGLIK